MAKPKKKSNDGEFLFFDVLYDDGTRSSNRKIAASEIDPYGNGGDAEIKALIEAQDRKIAELSGRPRGAVKSVSRSNAR